MTSSKMNNRAISIFMASMFLLSIVYLESCKHSPLSSADITDIIPANNTDTTGNNYNEVPCDPDSVYFENTILPLFISNCAKSGCHDAITAKEGIILNSYSNIMSTGDIEPYDINAGDIVEVITETDPDKKMPPPPSSSLTQNQINDLIKWINQGARNNSCNNCDTLNITYNAKIKPIIDAKCRGCHSGTTPPQGINLTAYNGVFAIAANGSLLGSINHYSGYSAMPKGGNKLPQCEIDAIAIWINDGAPNN